MDINKEINEIIYKWDIDRHYPDYRKCEQAQDYIKRYFGVVGGESPVLLLGTDKAAVKIVADSIPVNVVVKNIVYDSVDDITEESVKNYASYNVVYFASAIGEEYIVRLQKFGVNVIWLRHILFEQGLEFQKEFYQFYSSILTEDVNCEKESVEEYIDCAEYIKLKLEFESTNNEEQRSILLYKMYFMALHMRNFVLAEELVQTTNNEKIKCCWSEVCSLLEKIKQAMAKRKQKDIVIYWLDAVGEGQDVEMKYLQSRKEHSYYFKNMYTIVGQTTPTLQTIFLEKRPVSDGGALVENINKNRSSLLRDIYDKGYSLKICSALLGRWFPREFCIVGTQRNSSASRVFWEGLHEMLNTNKPAVYLLHELIETHSPNMSPKNISLDYNTENNIRNGRVEADEQLRFYDSLINDEAYRIYMSDHGTRSFKYRYHSVMQLYHKQWAPKGIDGLYSIMDLGQFIRGMMEGHDINIMKYEREFVPIEGVDRYNWKQIKYMIETKSFTKEWSVGFTGATDGKVLYMKYRTGEEVFHEFSKLPEIGEDIDVFSDSHINEEYKNKLRKVTVSYPTELLNNEKFKKSHIIDAIYYNIKKYSVECKDILNTMLEQYEDSSVALRMGGRHSLILLNWLTEENRRKIGVIIDTNLNCPCAYLNIPVIAPEDSMPLKIKAILLSSKRNLSMLQEEAEKMYSSYDIIDIYKALELNGFVCDSEFFNGDNTCYDVDLR